MKREQKDEDLKKEIPKEKKVNWKIIWLSLSFGFVIFVGILIIVTPVLEIIMDFSSREMTNLEIESAQADVKKNTLEILISNSGEKNVEKMGVILTDKDGKEYSYEIENVDLKGNDSLEYTLNISLISDGELNVLDISTIKIKKSGAKNKAIEIIERKMIQEESPSKENSKEKNSTINKGSGGGGGGSGGGGGGGGSGGGGGGGATIISCSNECSTEGYFCEEENYYRCLSGVDGCLDKSLSDKCSATEICVEESGCISNGVSISSCQNLTVSGRTYLLNISVSGFTNTCFNVTAENVTLDCNGNLISTTSSVPGIYSSKDKTTVRDCVFEVGLYNGGWAIDLVGANDSMILNNTVNLGRRGIYVHTPTTNVTIRGNEIDHMLDQGIYLFETFDSVVEDNVLTNHSQVSILLVESEDNLIKGNEISNGSGQGITLEDGTVEGSGGSNTIEENIILRMGGPGINIETPENVIRSNFVNASYVESGIQIFNSSGNVVEDNNLTFNEEAGLQIRYGSDNEARGNSLDKNVGTGLLVYGDSDNNLFESNSVEENGNLGLYVEETEADENNFTTNSICNNGYDAYCDSVQNFGDTNSCEANDGCSGSCRVCGSLMITGDVILEGEDKLSFEKFVVAIIFLLIIFFLSLKIRKSNCKIVVRKS